MDDIYHYDYFFYYESHAHIYGSVAVLNINRKIMRKEDASSAEETQKKEEESVPKKRKRRGEKHAKEKFHRIVIDPFQVGE